MKENINEHDMTKKMMEIVRGGYTTRLINEVGEVPNMNNDAPVQAPNPEDSLPADGREDKDTMTVDPADAIFKGDNRKRGALVSYWKSFEKAEEIEKTDEAKEKKDRKKEKLHQVFVKICYVMVLL